MKKKYVALMAGVAASMAIAAPMAMASEAPELPGSAGEPNGNSCSVEPGQTETRSNVPALQLPVTSADEFNQGNCESFGNDQHNGEYSNGAGSGSDVGNGIGSGFGGFPSTGGLPQ